MYIITIRILMCALLFLGGVSSGHAQMFTDPDDLADAVNSSAGGGTFTVRDGAYRDFESSFEVTGTAANPIIIKAQSIGGVVLTGASHFVLKKSAHVIIEGFVFDGEGEDTLIKLEGCNHVRITRNVFELDTEESIKWVFIGGVYNDNVFPFDYPSHNNRIDHNLFQNKSTPGHYITVDGSFDNTGSDEVYYQSQHDRIDHNHFRNNGPRARNEQESIRIGWSEMSLSSGFTVVEHNLFEDCDGDPEIVSVKSSDNFIRHNTFMSSYGTLSLRHGNRNHIEGNYFFGNGKPISTSPDGASLHTGGIRIYGADHMIINNYMEGLNGTIWDAPIALTQGDAIDGRSSNLSKHFRAERVTIAYNTLVNNSHGIEIGFDNKNNFNTDLKDIIITNNLITGSENSLVEIIEPGNDQGDEITWINNIMHPTGEATILRGARTTSFDDTQSINTNPFLEFDAEASVWRTTQSTPVYDDMNANTIEQDIEGQTRPVSSNPGADHFSQEAIRFRPLTSIDVGPQAMTDQTTSIFAPTIDTDVTIYPSPGDDVLTISGITLELQQVNLVDFTGRVIYTKQENGGTEQVVLNTDRYPSGMYILSLTYDSGVETRNVIIQH